MIPVQDKPGRRLATSRRIEVAEHRDPRLDTTIIIAHTAAHGAADRFGVIGVDR